LGHEGRFAQALPPVPAATSRNPRRPTRHPARVTLDAVPLLEELDFRPEHPEAVIERMERLASSGAGWVMLRPGVDEAELPPAGGMLGAIFGSRLPEVPVLSWVPAPSGRRERSVVEIGVEHARRRRVAAWLDTQGLRVPSTWRLRQDHPTRGLVVEVPLAERHAAVLAWLLAVGAALSPVRLTGEWRASVYVRRQGVRARARRRPTR
jgi:hypothetical protein